MQGRDNGAVRYLAYTVFAVEMLYLASVTVGSILGTSGSSCAPACSWRSLPGSSSAWSVVFPQGRGGRLVSIFSLQGLIPKRRYLAAAVTVALLQTAVLGYIVESRASILRTERRCC
jgi:hypothetical protein